MPKSLDEPFAAELVARLVLLGQEPFLDDRWVAIPAWSVPGIHRVS